MSKRSASSQLTGSTQEGDPFANQDLMRDDDPVRQVSAADRAKRRIKVPKSRKFGGTSQQGPTIFPNPFANVEVNQLNGSVPSNTPQPAFSFGSNSSFPPTNTSNFGQTHSASASFPAPQNGGSTGFSFGSTAAAPPSGGFSFSVAGSNNPFSNMNGTGNNSTSTNGIGSSGFSGSIFGSTPSFQQPTSNGFGLNPSSNLFQTPNSFGAPNDDGMQISPQASPAKKIASEEHKPSIFGGATVTPPFQTTNLFGQKAQNTPSVSQSSTTPAPSGIFGQLTSSTSTTTQPAVSSTAPAAFSFGAKSDNQTPQKPLFNPFQSKPAETPNTTQTSPSPALFNPFQSNASSPAPPEESRSTSPFNSGFNASPSLGNVFQSKGAESPASKPASSSTPTPSLFQFSTPTTAPVPNLSGSAKPSFEHDSPVKPVSSATPSQNDAAVGLNPPSSFSEEQKKAFTQILDLRSLNSAFRRTINETDIGSNWARICISYVRQSKKILAGDSSIQHSASSKPNAANTLSISEDSKTRTPEQSLSTAHQNTPNGPSQTSNLFKSIVDGGEQLPSESSTPVRPPISAPASTKALPQNTANNPFTIKPSNGNSSSDDSAKIKPPVFGSVGGSTNFMAQFAKKAEQDALKAKQQRKDSDFDSDEEDEASWDEKDEELQRKKREELAEIAKKNVVKFVPGKGFTFGGATDNSSNEAEAQPKSGAGSSLFAVAGNNQTKPPSNGASIFDNQTSNHLKAPMSNNIFAHLSDAESGAEGSKAGDADDEDTDFSGESDGDPPKPSPSKSLNGPTQKRRREEESDDGESLEDAIRRTTGRSPKKTNLDVNSSLGGGRSLFDRITPADTPAERSHNVSDNEGSTGQSPFGNAGRSNGTSTFTQSAFSQTPSTPPSNLFGSKPKTPGDHTWKPESPITFGTAAATSNTSAPIFNIIPATPDKSVQGSSNNPVSSLFGTKSDKPSFSLFNTSTTPTGSPAKPASEVGFSFGGPPKSLFPGGQNNFVFNSGASSRATSPGGETSAAESTDGADTEPPADPQSDLTSLTDAEKRDNDVLFESLKVKCLQFDAQSEKKWEPRGLGPLRVLKNKESGVTTILCRASPSGKIVLNSRLLQSVEYKRVQKGVVRITVLDKDGNPCLWMVKVGTDEVAEKLAAVLMENRPK